MSYGAGLSGRGRANISMLPGGGGVMGVGDAVPKNRGDLLVAPPAPTAPVPKAPVAGRRAGGGLEPKSKVGGYADVAGSPLGGFHLERFGVAGTNQANSSFGSPGAGSMSNSAIGAPAADTSKEDEDMQKEAQMLMDIAKRKAAQNQVGSESSGSTNTPRTGRTRILVA